MINTDYLITMAPVMRCNILGSKCALISNVGTNKRKVLIDFNKSQNVMAPRQASKRQVMCGDPSTACSLPTKQKKEELAPGRTMEKGEASGGSVMLWAMFCW